MTSKEVTATILDQLAAAGIQGVIHVTGPHDSGKTTFALECGATPDRICFIDDDTKTSNMVIMKDNKVAGYGGIGSQGLARYEDFSSLTYQRTLADTFKIGRDLIDSIQPGQYDVIIWDTWTRFGSTFKSYVTAHPGEFRAGQDWAPVGKMKGAQQWNEAQRLEQQLLGQLASKCRILFLITHLKDFYWNDARTGKQVPDCSKSIARVASLRTWLLHNPTGSPVPVALVLKRPSVKVLTSLGIRTANYLPRKIVPKEHEQSLWDAIMRLWTNAGQDLEEPALTEMERSIIDGLLTKEQQQTLKLALRAQIATADPAELAAADATDPGATDPAILDQIQELKQSGLSNKAIADQLGITVRELADIRKAAV